jgi:hypothetical protein
MNDDFRVHVTLATSSDAHHLQKALAETGLIHLMPKASDQIAVSVDGSEAFLYAGSSDDAEQAASAVTAFGTEQGWTLTPEIRRWHPAAEEWEDASAPLPSTPSEVAAERADVIAAERAESERYGVPEWEVRIECDTHADCVSLAATLRDEGIPNVRRSHFLLVGVTDEQAGAEFVDRVKGLGGVTSAKVEGSVAGVEMTATAVGGIGRANPFRLFTGPTLLA